MWYWLCMSAIHDVYMYIHGGSARYDVNGGSS